MPLRGLRQERTGLINGYCGVPNLFLNDCCGDSLVDGGGSLPVAGEGRGRGGGPGSEKWDQPQVLLIPLGRSRIKSLVPRLAWSLLGTGRCALQLLI